MPTRTRSPRIRWAPFMYRPALVGHWVAVWWLPRYMWGPHVVCDRCNPISPAPATFAWHSIRCGRTGSRTAWRRPIPGPVAPIVGRAPDDNQLTRAPVDFPLLLTSHDPQEELHTPARGFTTGPGFSFGYRLGSDWRQQWIRRHS